MFIIGIVAVTGKVFCQDTSKAVSATRKPVLGITKTDTISKVVSRRMVYQTDTINSSGADGAEKAAAPVKEEAAKIEAPERTASRPEASKPEAPKKEVKK